VSELIAAPADPQDLVEEPEHVLEGVRQPSVGITEQAAAFSTAVAVGLPRTKPTSRVMAALRAMLLSSSRSPRPPRHGYPPRFYAFLEDAAMERGLRRPCPRS
jgi:hypothetical protein